VLRLKILDAVIAHTDDMPQHDDQTLLLMEVLE
jgi:serine phosphatase RsbU (regulator of sigma subunit)